MTNGTLHLGALILFIGLLTGATFGSRGDRDNIWDTIANMVCGLGAILMLVGLASDIVWVGQ